MYVLLPRLALQQALQTWLKVRWHGVVLVHRLAKDVGASSLENKNRNKKCHLVVVNLLWR